jgi:hypothetical protein
MREQHAVIVRTPLQHDRIGVTGKSDILYPDDIQLGFATKETADYIVIEIFVCGEAEHG